MSNIQQGPSFNSDNTTPDGSSQSAGTGQAASFNAPASASAARLAGAGLASGAVSVLQDIAGRVFNFDWMGANGTPLNPEADWRVRIGMRPATAALFYNNQSNAIMYPLSQTRGVIFPYTPTLSVTHSAKYGQTPLTHSNYSSYFYEGSEVQSIQITGEFTVQNLEDGQYLMAAIHFFRACTKMFFGNSPLAGTPPPMVFLSGFGDAYLPTVPCVITNFSHTMPADVDYVKVPVGVSLDNIVGNQINTNMAGSAVRLPTMSTINLTLQPIYSRRNVADNFTLEKFSAGALIDRGFL
jgi:hypothetical protein